MALNKLLLAAIAAVVISSVFAIISLSDQSADAGSPNKIHFTQTITSTQDPGLGHEGHQLALVLSPSPGILYDGSMTFTSSAPMQVVVLHEIKSSQAKGQPTWTVDGEAVYGLSLIEMGKSGSFEFTGAALALHSPNPEEFTATVSVDGWLRGQPAEIITQTIVTEKKEKTIALSHASVPAKIPMHKGVYQEGEIFYIVTDASDKDRAQKITDRQKWKVELAPPLAKTPKESLQTVYVFTNGIRGQGMYGLQADVFSATPKVPEYSALNKLVEVTWKKGQNPTVLKSEDEVIKAKEGGRVDFMETGVVINAPQIVWPGGQMKVRADKTISDTMEYGGGQITEINRDEMTVTFVAHRGWGPDGRTIYYIVTDATPSGPAEMMGVTHSASSAKLVTSPAAVDLYQFKNGIKGTGPLGFQPGIASAALGYENYSPMWRIFLVEWNNPDEAQTLETKHDIDSMKSKEKISVIIARPVNSDHIVNCPFIDPFQNP